jgi:fermentation-respiration switch protein FrsA (DUF1100 family)
MYILIAILLTIIIFLTVGSIFFANLASKPKVRDHDETYTIDRDEGKINEEWYNSLQKEPVSISSPYGYKLDGIFFPVKNSKKVIIFCHGITWSKFGSVKYMNMFYKRGFNVLIYDHRNHGRSGGTFTTFGYFEKYDLDACVDWVINKIGQDAYIGVHGESMGAGTALQHCGISNRVSFYIADCPYSDLKQLFRVRLKEDFKMPGFPILYTSSLLSKLKYKFLYKDISPISDIKDKETPILFIHGQQDNYIPNQMSIDMYNAKKGIKKLYLAPNADHAASYWQNREEYEQVVEEFLNEIGS